LCHLELGENSSAILALRERYGKLGQSDADFVSGADQLAAGDVAAAAVRLDRYVARRPDDAYAHLLLAAAEMDQGNREEAAAHAQQARGIESLAPYADQI